MGVSSRRQGSRSMSTAARAERDGVVVCPDVLVVVEGLPAGLGTVARDDMTAWFYGALERGMDEDLEGLTAAAQSGQREPEVTVDLVLQTPGGVLRLDGCRLGLPVRHDGPASTLQYRVSHPGVAADSLEEAEPVTREVAVERLVETIDSVLEVVGEPEPEETTGSGPAIQQAEIERPTARPDPMVETIDAVLDRLWGAVEPVEEPPVAASEPLRRRGHLSLVYSADGQPPCRAA
jgi:hypothetical protein